MSRRPQQPQPQQPPGGGGGGGGMTDCCRGCWDATPAVTRGLMLLGLFAGVAGPFLYDRFQTCAEDIIESKGVQLYRIILSPLFGRSFFQAFFVTLMAWQTGAKLELSRGSVLVFVWALVTAWLTYALIFAVGAAFYAGGSITYGMCESGLWCVVMGLFTIECMFDTAAERRFMCCPINVRPAYQPLLLIVLMSVMMMTLSLGMLFGTAIGYAIAYFPALEIRADTVRRWEAAGAWSFLTARDTFIAIDKAGTIQPWSFGQPPQPRDRDDSSSAGGGAFRSGPRNQGMGSGSGSGITGGGGGGDTKPVSVFASGTGHRLGDSSAVTISPSAPPLSAAAGGGAAAGGATKMHRPGMGHVLADRLARAQSGSGAAGGAASGTRTPSASTSVQQQLHDAVGGGSSVNSTASAAGSPSGASVSASASEAAAAAAVAHAVSEPDHDDEHEPGHGHAAVPISGPVSLVRPGAGGGGGGSVYIGIGSDGGASGGAGSGDAKAKGAAKKQKNDVELQPMLGGAAGDHDDPQSVSPFDAALRRLQDMAFGRDDALRALNACDGDDERAAQLLHGEGK